ncbi:rhamnulokinase [Paenibacillus anaericanus]|uniref:Rhamnulokinase n=1 Tax=Paenibacillus anaericanus TaxID=170367 RepID=A0A433Y979_9BACL|nr:rhamnulokinase family protein [Paenibacillus anaericanus]RUT46460.1 rhamnulokinase [Paenibacillus anaericanus]
MNNTATVLAFDIGASSGRALIGQIVQQNSGEPGLLTITEIHRFPNIPVQIGNHLHWDTVMLLQEVKNGIRKAFQAGYTPESYGIDTWGVDFGLLDSQGELLGIPYHYRDPQTEGLIEELNEKLGRERLFQESGLQFMPFNTIYQLYAMLKAGSPKLDIAETLLLTPDLLHYFLTGEKVCEFTMATTTQLYDAGQNVWNKPLMKELGLSPSLFLDPIEPGTVIGTLSEEVCRELKVPSIKAIAVASHDTESAAAAVPAHSTDFAYLVCGTWSLLGTELSEALLLPEVLEHNFSNEGGAFGTFQLLKNIMGLWILQECKRRWELNGVNLSFPEMVKLAEAAEPFRSLIDPDDLRFMNPADMVETIAEYCRESGQLVPETEGQFIRCILESLALRYREVLEKTEVLAGRSYAGLHMVGGGIQNELLCRFTAEAIGRPVWAGPIEASAIGNMLLQFVAGGHVQHKEEGIELVKRSFPLAVYHPETPELWSAAFQKYVQITGR